ARRDGGVFTAERTTRSPDGNGFRHRGCPKARGAMPWAVPVRFVTACEHGHLDDFPWIDYAHKGPTCGAPQLELPEHGGSGSAAEVLVRCRACKSQRALSQAFEDSRDEMPICRGRHPHLGTFDGCDGTRMRAMLLGASNLWFPARRTALTLPRTTALSPLA